MSLSGTLRSLEQSLLLPFVRKDPVRVAAMLADEFCEFGSSGTVYSKAEILALLVEEEEIEVAMEEFVCRPVGADAALVTYRSVRTSGDGSGSSSPVRALRSSVWICRDGRWQMMFHQGTRVKE